MKRVLLTTASVLALGLAGSAWANNATVDQSGSNNTSNISQDGTSITLPDGTVVSSGGGTGGTANVTQSGNNGQVGVAQSGTGTNSATVKQLTPADKARASVNQFGTGALNTVLIEQVNVIGPTTASATQNGQGNAAEIHQGTTKKMTNGSSVVTQTGDNNTALSYQSSTTTGGQAINGNKSTISQTNANNWARVRQMNDPAPAPGNSNYEESSVVQNGTYNLADVTQGGNGGNSQKSYVNQSGTSAGAWGHEAYVTQTGDRDLSQIDQTGSNNTATVTQRTAKTSYVTQTGNDNGATVQQSGGGNADSTVNQYGDSGTVSVQQANNTFSASIVQHSTVLQDGNTGGYVSVNQALGTGLTGSVLQTSYVSQSAGADYAQAIVNQTGQNVTANVFQTTDHAIANVTQGGMNNTATVNQ